MRSCPERVSGHGPGRRRHKDNGLIENGRRKDSATQYQLARHRIKAQSKVIVRREGSSDSQLLQVVKDEGTDLLVTLRAAMGTVGIADMTCALSIGVPVS